MPVLLVGIDIFGNRRWTEVVKSHEELNAKVVSDEIFKQKKTHITAKVDEEGEEVGIARKRGRKWAVHIHVVAADALKRQIEAVRNIPVEPPGRVDGRLAIDLVAGKNHHATDRVGDCQERLVLFLGKLFCYRL